MRKLIFSILLASVAATPALAAPGDRDDRQQTREERQQAREDRQQARQERQQPREQPVDRSADLARPSGGNFSGGGVVRPDYSSVVNRQNFDAARAQRETVRQQADSVANWRSEERQQTREQRLLQQQQQQQRSDAVRNEIEQRRSLRQLDRPLPNVMRTRTPVVSNVPRPGTQPPLRVESRRTPEVQWNTSWRHDNRYDWQNWRRHHHSLFHFGFYIDPFGWGYQPYSIGWRLWPSYYSSSFWLNDPWMYRLPYAPPGTRWIRYYDDALLVDMWTGEVVDVIYNFFW